MNRKRRINNSAILIKIIFEVLGLVVIGILAAIYF